MLMFYMAMIDDEADQLRFADFYNQYRKQMLYVSYHILNDYQEAEDAVQVALLGIAQHIRTVPTGNEKVVKAYVLTAARNAALNLAAKKKRLEADNILDFPLAANDELFEQVAASEDYALLMKAMGQLPIHYREVLMLIYVQEQSVKDAAAILKRREGTVRQQLNRGKRMLVELCRKEGMCFEKENIDTSKISGEMLTAVFASLAQEESLSISSNMRWSIQKRMQNGTFVPTTMAFGYARENGQTVIHAEQAIFVYQIFSRYISGESTREIASWLNGQKESCPVLAERVWTYKAVARILKNEKYIGDSLWQKTF